MVTTLIDAIGYRFLSSLKAILAFGEFLYLPIRYAFTPKAKGGGIDRSEFFSQLYFTGVQALLTTTLLGFSCGYLLALVSSNTSFLLTDSSMLTRVLLRLMAAELGPFLISLLVIARSVTAMASELGNRSLAGEIEALRMANISPYSYLLFPRIVGASLSCLCLGVAFSTVLGLGFWLGPANMASSNNIKQMLVDFWTPDLFLIVCCKYLLPNAVAFLIACNKGLSVNRSSLEVPRAVSSAVFVSILTTLALHALLSACYYSGLLKVSL